MSTPDKRCCGSGVCIINDQGECWCGQVWNGEKMVAPTLKMLEADDSDEASPTDKPESKPEA
jgi:hypothetical protein